MSTRRNFMYTLGMLPLLLCFPRLGQAQSAVQLSTLKAGYMRRLKRILAAGVLPYIDIESSCKPSRLDMDDLAKSMDTLNIGLMALSADDEEAEEEESLLDRLISHYPEHFIPVGDGGAPPTLAFLDDQEVTANSGKILLLGEYEFRHYPSPRQVKRHNTNRDVKVPIDGAVGHRAFALSEKTGLPLQIHYEIEDELLTPLEMMLEKYPKAKIIWCHFAQIRYIERASRYTPLYVDALIRRFPNLYFDTAFGSASSVYPLSNQHHARVWAEDGTLKAEWKELIVAHQSRFLSALDLGGDRMHEIVERDNKLRYFLSHFPTEVQHQLAYRNAWRLLFSEEFE